jgi:hypothetical protein
MRYSLTGTVGDFTPRHGCRAITKSLSAVVKTADSTILLCRIVAGETPATARAVTHWRTCTGKIEDIRIGPNAVALPGARLQDVVREPHVVDVGPEGHAASPRVGGPTGGVRRLHLLPGPIGVPAGGERPGGPLPALGVKVVRGVAGTAVVADPLAAESHRH